MRIYTWVVIDDHPERPRRFVMQDGIQWTQEEIKGILAKHIFRSEFGGMEPTDRELACVIRDLTIIMEGSAS